MRIALTIAAASVVLWLLVRRRKQIVPVTHFDPVSGRWQRVCGRCRSGALRRSRPRGLRALLQQDRGFTRYYRCGECAWGGWLEVVESPRESIPEGHGQPSLEALDAPDFGALPSARTEPADMSTLSLPDLGRVVDAPVRQRRRVRVSKPRTRRSRYRSR